MLVHGEDPPTGLTVEARAYTDVEPTGRYCYLGWQPERFPAKGSAWSGSVGQKSAGAGKEGANPAPASRAAGARVCAELLTVGGTAGAGTAWCNHASRGLGAAATAAAPICGV